MSRKDKMRLPSSEAGIVRYFDDEYKSMFVFHPKYIVVLTIAVAVFAVALRLI